MASDGPTGCSSLLITHGARSMIQQLANEQYLLQYIYMKSLSLARPLVIYMVGKPGAGKSFFARQFGETFGAPIISVDRLRSELFSEPTYSTEEQQIIDRLVDYQFSELLKTRRTIILDGNCNVKAKRITFDTVAHRAGYQTLSIWVQTDDSTAKQRSLKRSDKRPEDVYNRSLNDEQYQNLTKRFTQPTAEPHIVISGKHTYATQARTVLKRLVETHQAEAESA